MTHELSEWLETDGLGGFASGTVSGIRTRRYHGVLLTATTPPTGRMMLVNGVEAWAITPKGRVALSTHLYQPGLRHPDGVSRLVAFSHRPWPTWTWDIGMGTRIIGELFATAGTPRVVMTWRAEGAGQQPVGLELRPLMSGRDYHAVHHENAAFAFQPERHAAVLRWRPYDGGPAVSCLTTGEYHHSPEWYRQFLYSAERERGLDDTEDLASPGVISFSRIDLREAAVVWQAGELEATDAEMVSTFVEAWRVAERRRRERFDTPLAFSADQYLVRRGTGRTIVAGYPWFTDWGRDTFIALRGVCLATGRFADARDILLEWAGTVSEGMLPNRFPDSGDAPEFNSVDASLWFVIAVHELRGAAVRRPGVLSRTQNARLQDACLAIVEGYARGTRYGIRMDDDSLLAAGEPGQQLTWMDARVGDREITPRIGKPVEIQALWLNALHAVAAFDAGWGHTLARGTLSFGEKFWNADRRILYDVVDVNHVRGISDATFRPNQILAVGGLPLPIVTNGRAGVIVDAVERHLWTPLGLRSLARMETGYVPHYEGDGSQRDAAYHQGTVWPWLAGPFVDAWLRVRGYSEEARVAAFRRFVAPLEEHLESAGLGHVSEIADADTPFIPRGCPFQAWSLGELIRAKVLAPPVIVPLRSGAASVEHASVPAPRRTRVPQGAPSCSSDA
jgi:predicted glycogen debranching enzyme